MNDNIILIASNFLTAVAAWLIGKRKSNAETDNLVLTNLEKSIGLYKEMIDDLKNEIKELNIKVSMLEKKIDELHSENIMLKSRGL
jgi:peptidoglycan hydrolase CwlO-like protein